MRKKIISFAVTGVLSLTLILPGIPAYAKKSLKIHDIDYKGNGTFEVELNQDVNYHDISFQLTDESGKKYTLVLQDDHDLYDDDYTFRIKNAKKGVTYQLTVKKGSTNLTKSFTIPEDTSSHSKDITVVIKDIEYDIEDKEIDVQFKSKVRWKNPSVKVVDSSGKSYPAKLVEKDNDDCTIFVDNLKEGKKYTLTISGIKGKKDKTYGSVSKAFYAIDD